MPRSVSLPAGVKPFDFHGVVLSPREEEWLGECPFCGKQKFYVNAETGLWNCQRCVVGGNPQVFLWKLHEASLETTPESAYAELSEEKGISAGVMREWGLCRSATTGEWLLPGYNPGGRISNLYRYVRVGDGRHVWMGTTTFHQSLHGLHLSREKGRIDVCEGPWDGMAWREYLRTTKRNDDGTYSPTGNPDVSLLSERDVVAVPGAGAWGDSWSKVVADKDVTFLYDRDKPGLDGTRHACASLSRDQEYVPKSVSYLNWEKSRVEYPDGYDVRDHLTNSGRDGVAELLSLTEPIPAGWTPGGGRRGQVEVTIERCESWRSLRQDWQRAMRWTPGLEGALACMLASITSVRSGQEQLWFKIIGPPSCGKTSLCEALSTATRYVLPKSDMTSFYSGYKDEKDWSPERDFSLAKRLFDKTLITKDADTLLTNPNKEMILGQARDIYDTMARKDYGHGVHLNYVGLRMTWILCGTPALREIDRSELGQRFLDWVIMDTIEEDLEDDVITRAILSQKKGSLVESNCKADTLYGKDYLRAMKRTGGYVEYLRRNWPALLADVEAKEPPYALRVCVTLAKFVSYLRARPGSETHEDATREIGARLGKQLYKLAQFLAVVLQRETIDDAVLALVRKIALDTARGRTTEIMKALHKHGPRSGEGLAQLTGQKWKTEEEYLTFLRAIGALEVFDARGEGPAVGGRWKWRMTERFGRVWQEVMGRGETQEG